MRFKKIGIKWNLFFSLTAFVTLLLILLWFFQTVCLEGFYKNIKTQTIRHSADTICKNIDNEDLQTLVERIAQNNEICIRIVDTWGQDICSADIVADCIIHKLPWPALLLSFEKAEENGGSTLEFFSRENFTNRQYDQGHFLGNPPPRDEGMKQSLLFIQLAELADGSQVMVMLNSTITPVNATVETLRIQLVYITVIMLILALILALLLSRRISKPIVKINDSAKKLAAGCYDVNFEGQGYREIEELSDTLNYAAKELSKVESLRRELIANISHDLRTPLTMIAGYGELMRDLPQENTPENAQIIVDEAQRLSSLVTDILDLSKLQSGTQTLTLSRFNLTSDIRDILKRYTKLMEQQGYQIQFQAEEEAWLEADRAKIFQVVYNLINNALHYTGADRSVVIRQILRANKVRIEIIDTGEGIAPDQLPHIWDRYYRTDKAHKQSSMGTGLGLSIVKSVLELHHAPYGVDSTLGQGSVFWFELGIDRCQEI